MAHHHQLSAHSHLTNLIPGQIHYFQLPITEVLQGTSFQYEERQRLQQQILRSTSIVHDGAVLGLGRRSGICVICLVSLPPGVGGGVYSPAQLFSKCCELLDVPYSEIQNEWNFDREDKLPFCLTCSRCNKCFHNTAIQVLISLQHQLEIVKKKFDDGIENIRIKIRQTESHAYGADTKTTNFRARALGTQFLSTTNPYQSSSSIVQPQPSSLDITAAAANIMENYHYPFNSSPVELGFQQQQAIAENSNHSEPEPCASLSLDNEPFSLTSHFTPEETAPIEDRDSCNDFDSPPFPSRPSSSDDSNIDAEDYQSYEEQPLPHFSHGHNTISVASHPSTSTLVVENYSYVTPQTSEAHQKVKSKSKGKRPQSKIKKKPKEAVAVTSKKLSRKRKVPAQEKHPKRKCLESFAPFQTDEQGQTTYEGIVITSTESGFICSLCGAKCGKGGSDDKGSIRKIKIHIKGFHLGAYKCQVCQKNFTSNDILLQHTVRSHNQNDVPCDICGKPIRPRYLNHHKITHMNPEEKQNFIMATGFKPPSYSNVKPTHMCNTCGKMFKKKSILRRHESIHLDKRLRTKNCGMCDRVYSSDQALKEHQLLNHDTTGAVRRSMCKHCGKLMFPKQLKLHLLSHAPKECRQFCCKICGRRLLSKSMLEQHERNHDPSDEPEKYKFECDTCGRRFLNFKSLRIHRSKSHGKAKTTKGD